MKKSELTTEQLKFFEQEEKDVQENILKALSRGSVSKVLKTKHSLMAVKQNLRSSLIVLIG